MRTNNLTEGKLFILKESLHNALTRKEAWELVEGSNNLDLILDNFETFLPSAEHGEACGTLFPSTDTEKLATLFEIYSIISLSRPKLFRSMLEKFTAPNLNFETLLNKMFAYSGPRSHAFEIALALCPPNVCQSIVDIYFDKSLNIPTRSFADHALQQSLELNTKFNSKPEPNTQSFLAKSLCKEQKALSLLERLPLSYHGRLLRLCYLTYNTEISNLSSYKASFKKFVPHLIAQHHALPPLSHYEETTFLSCMHIYFSVAKTCWANYNALISNEVKSSATPLILDIALTNYTPPTIKMHLIYDALKPPYTPLALCEHYLGTEKQPPLKKQKTQNSTLL